MRDGILETLRESELSDEDGDSTTIPTLPAEIGCEPADAGSSSFFFMTCD
jgi:hypothetical protein